MGLVQSFVLTEDNAVVCAHVNYVSIGKLFIRKDSPLTEGIEVVHPALQLSMAFRTPIDHTIGWPANS
jgi:hypothetical protein